MACGALGDSGVSPAALTTAEGGHIIKDVAAVGRTVDDAIVVLAPVIANLPTEHDGVLLFVGLGLEVEGGREMVRGAELGGSRQSAIETCRTEPFTVVFHTSSRESHPAVVVVREMHTARPKMETELADSGRRVYVECGVWKRELRLTDIHQVKMKREAETIDVEGKVDISSGGKRGDIGQHILVVPRRRYASAQGAREGQGVGLRVLPPAISQS